MSALGHARMHGHEKTGRISYRAGREEKSHACDQMIQVH